VLRSHRDPDLLPIPEFRPISAQLAQRVRVAAGGGWGVEPSRMLEAAGADLGEGLGPQQRVAAEEAPAIAATRPARRAGRA
jgi:hypothetical protein